MPAWIIITAANLNDYAVAEQMDALRAEALAPGQADPFVGISTDVILKIRAYIASNPANRVDPDPATIPAELKTDCCHLILAPMFGRLGIALTEDQRKAVDMAHSTLIALRDGKLLVSQPDDGVEPEVQGGPGTEVVNAPARRFTRESLDSL